jgi:hypothetical protein
MESQYWYHEDVEFWQRVESIQLDFVIADGGSVYDRLPENARIERGDPRFEIMTMMLRTEPLSRHTPHDLDGETEEATT